MNEKPESIWTKPLKVPRSFAGWLITAVIAGFVLSLLTAIIVEPRHWPPDWRLVEIGTVAGILLASLYFLVRWLCCWRNFKRFLFCLVCGATLMALFYAEEDWRGWRAWNRFKQERETKGEKLYMAGVTPPPVPPARNFALTPIWVESMKAKLGPRHSRLWFGEPFAEDGRTNFTDRLALDIHRTDDYGRENEPTNGDWALATTTDLRPWQAYYRAPYYRTPYRAKGKSVAATNEFPVSPQPQSPAADVLLALSRYDSTIEELRAASRLPDSRFPLNYDCELPSAILLPHLACLKGCSLVLQLRAIAELQNGQSGPALADVTLALRLLAANRSEPFLISHLVRLAIWRISLQPIWEGCARHEWSDAQLAALEAELAMLDFSADYALSMRGEMATQDTCTDWLRRHPAELQNVAGMFESDVELPGSLVARLIPSGWFYQNQLRCDRVMVDFYIPAADLSQGVFSPAADRRGDAVVAAETKAANPFNVLERQERPWLGQAAKKFAFGQASVNLARAAVALERYRLAHGEYPESLEALAPKYLAAVPHDVIGGQPLKYHRKAGGRFVLYSIGWNETDDGGKVEFKQNTSSPRNEDPKSPIDMDRGDWVWEYPAE